MKPSGGTPRRKGELVRIESMPVPALSPDLELRPRNTEPASAARLLASRVADYIDDLDLAVQGFRRLAEEARRRGDVVLEGSALRQLAEACARVVAIAARGEAAPETRLTGQDSLPNWGALSLPVQQALSDAIDRAEEELRIGTWRG